MAIRRHRPGELVIEQTRDLAPVRAMIERAGMIAEGIEWPAGCYIVAFMGDEPIGVVGVESQIDTALIRSLHVIDTMRKRGVGTQLFAAARKAAHTRGARHLYAFGDGGAGDYLRRLGFEPERAEDAVLALSGTPLTDYYRAHPEEMARKLVFHLDISNDGVIER